MKDEPKVEQPTETNQKVRHCKAMPAGTPKAVMQELHRQRMMLKAGRRFAWWQKRVGFSSGIGRPARINRWTSNRHLNTRANARRLARL